jgi:adenylylsulfate kinase-like enzyme
MLSPICWDSMGALDGQNKVEKTGTKSLSPSNPHTLWLSGIKTAYKTHISVIIYLDYN